MSAIPDSNGTVGDIGESVILYGNINFDGKGHYVISNETVWDSDLGVASGLSCYLSHGVCATGVPVQGDCSISASGYGYLTNPITNELIYGLVSANGVFAGSSTETNLAYSDLFIGAPIVPALPTNAFFQGAYTVAGFLPGADPLTSQDVFFQLTSDGAGNLGDMNITGYSGAGGSAALSQAVSGATYSFTFGTATINFPASATGPFFAAPEQINFSPDGNFFFGGSPGSANGPFDMIVGVRGTAAVQNLAGLYYQAGVSQNESQLSTGSADLNGYYGSFVATSAGDVIAHKRLNDVDLGVKGVTFADSIASPISTPYTDAATSEQYAVGASGAIRIGQGIFPFLGVSVALQAPSFQPSGPIYLNPTGIVNAASNSPFTAGVSNGELVTLYGSGFGTNPAVAPSTPYPTNLTGVQVTVNGIAAPIYSVSPTSVSVIVPYENTFPLAEFQVTTNGASSNVVTEPVNETTPGVFTIPNSNGLGEGAILHGSDGTVVSPTNPAEAGEFVEVFLTGLGDVSPSVADGAAAPVGTLVNTTNTITASIAGVDAMVAFSGLAPGLAGLYQVNLQIPSGVPSGNSILDISGPDSSAMQALIFTGAPAPSARPSAVGPVHHAPRIQRKQPCLGGPGKACSAP